jgi:hypothetical protein
VAPMRAASSTAPISVWTYGQKYGFKQGVLLRIQVEAVKAD